MEAAAADRTPLMLIHGAWLAAAIERWIDGVIAGPAVRTGSASE